jgi:hypothetical protein
VVYKVIQFSIRYISFCQDSCFFIILYFSLIFQLDTKFRGAKHAPRMRERTDPFRCRVKFEGKSVLEGIRGLADNGILDPKMPSHLRNLHSMGRNEITLAEKERTEETPDKR